MVSRWTGPATPPAVEADPNLAFEHWDEYWRKVHGPKFAYEEPGVSTKLVLRIEIRSTGSRPVRPRSSRRRTGR